MFICRRRSASNEIVRRSLIKITMERIEKKVALSSAMIYTSTETPWTWKRRLSEWQRRFHCNLLRNKIQMISDATLRFVCIEMWNRGLNTLKGEMKISSSMKTTYCHSTIKRGLVMTLFWLKNEISLSLSLSLCFHLQRDFPENFVIFIF